MRRGFRDGAAATQQVTSSLSQGPTRTANLITRPRPEKSLICTGDMENGLNTGGQPGPTIALMALPKSSTYEELKVVMNLYPIIYYVRPGLQLDRPELIFCLPILLRIEHDTVEYSGTY